LLYGSDHLGERIALTTLLISIVLLALFFRMAIRKGDKALIDLQLFKRKTFSASATTQFMSNGISFAGQMLIPIYLIRACGQSPSATGWLLPPLGVRMICSYPWIGALTQRFGIRRVSAGGAFLAFATTLPFIWLASHRLVPTVLACALFVRGIGLSAVGIPSISAAYASVRKQDLPMATTSLNIVQRLGGPALTILCAAFLMEVGDGTVQRWALRRIYRGLCSTLRTPCAPVCRRVETSVFHRQSDGTTRYLAAAVM
jgi:predicted MFS family arabinose efflux permease